LLRAVPPQGTSGTSDACAGPAELPDTRLLALWCMRGSTAFCLTFCRVLRPSAVMPLVDKSSFTISRCSLAVPPGERFLSPVGPASSACHAAPLTFTLLGRDGYSTGAIGRRRTHRAHRRVCRTSRPPNPDRLCGCHTPDTVGAHRQGTQTVHPHFIARRRNRSLSRAGLLVPVLLHYLMRGMPLSVLEQYIE
jgi:hypothetical protein